MQISNQEIKEYQQLHEALFGEAISEPEAREIANRVLTIYRLLIQPLPSERTSLANEQSATNRELSS